MNKDDLQQALSEIQQKALCVVMTPKDQMDLIFSLTVIIKELLSRIES